LEADIGELQARDDGGAVFVGVVVVPLVLEAVDEDGDVGEVVVVVDYEAGGGLAGQPLGYSHEGAYVK
jgi:hypothetical protein